MAKDDIDLESDGIEDNAEASLDDFFQPADKAGEASGEPSIDDFFAEPLPKPKGKTPSKTAPKQPPEAPISDDFDLDRSDEVPGVETDAKKAKGYKPPLPPAEEPAAPAAEPGEAAPPAEKKKGGAAKFIIMGLVVMVVLASGLVGGYYLVSKFFLSKKPTENLAQKDNLAPTQPKDKGTTGDKNATPPTDKGKTGEAQPPKTETDAGKKTETPKPETSGAKTEPPKTGADSGVKPETPKTEPGAKSEPPKTGADAGKKSDVAATGGDKKTETPKTEPGKSEPPKTGAEADKKSDGGKKETGKEAGDKKSVASVDTKNITPPATETPPEKKSGHQPVTSDGGPFSVQVGSYYLETSKKRPLALLSELGYTEYHFTPEYQRVRLYHVLVGHNLSGDEAQKIKTQLEGLGYAASLEGQGSVKAYSYGSSAIARTTQKKLLDAGFKDVHIKSETRDVNMDQLRVGKFSKARADRALRDLRQAGFKGAIIVRR